MSDEHTLGGWFTSKPADCDTEGEEKRKCADCDYFETKPSPALGHEDLNGDGICEWCQSDMSDNSEDNTNTENGGAEDGNNGGTENGDNNNTDNNGNENSGNSSDNDNGSTVTVVIVCIAAVAVIAVAVIVIKKKRV